MTAGAARRVLIAAALGLSLGAAAKPAPRTFRVVLADMAYGAAPSGARVGDVVEWVNADILRHTATARDGSFNVDLQPKAHAKTVLKKAGVVSFYCRYHPGMTGRFSVGK